MLLHCRAALLCHSPSLEHGVELLPGFILGQHGQLGNLLLLQLPHIKQHVPDAHAMGPKLAPAHSTAGRTQAGRRAGGQAGRAGWGCTWAPKLCKQHSCRVAPALHTPQFCGTRPPAHLPGAHPPAHPPTHPPTHLTIPLSSCVRATSIARLMFITNCAPPGPAPRSTNTPRALSASWLQKARSRTTAGKTAQQQNGSSGLGLGSSSACSAWWQDRAGVCFLGWRCSCQTPGLPKTASRLKSRRG